MNRILGTVPQQSLPCPSDADPGADDLDEQRAEILFCIDAAQYCLTRAENAILHMSDDEDEDVRYALDKMADAIIELGGRAPA